MKEKPEKEIIGFKPALISLVVVYGIYLLMEISDNWISIDFVSDGETIQDGFIALAGILFLVALVLIPLYIGQAIIRKMNGNLSRHKWSIFSALIIFALLAVAFSVLVDLVFPDAPNSLVNILTSIPAFLLAVRYLSLLEYKVIPAEKTPKPAEAQ